MKKMLSILLGAALLLSCCITEEAALMETKQVILQAHRGVSTDAPENTMAAFRLAVEQGYGVIECDPKFTRDNVCVMLHDKTLNRTGRIDGQKLPAEMKIAETDYADLANIDVGLWFAPEYVGERIPTLAESLEYMGANGILCKIDAVWEDFTPQQQEILFDVIDKHGKPGLVALTCQSSANVKLVAERFPDNPVMFDGRVTDKSLDNIAEAAAGHDVYIWMRMANELTSWSSMRPVTAQMAAQVKEHGFKLGLWIINDPAELEIAMQFGPDVIETNGGLKP